MKINRFTPAFLVLVIGTSLALWPQATVADPYRGSKVRPHVANQLIVKFKEGAGGSAATTGLATLNSRHKFKSMQRLFSDLRDPKLNIKDRASLLNHLSKQWMAQAAQQGRSIPSLNYDLNAVPNVHNIYLLEFDGNERNMENVAAEYQKQSTVEYAVPNYLWEANITPNDPSFASQYYLPKIFAPGAWDISKGDVNTVIAIVDTGVDWNHPDLAANIWTNTAEIPGNGIDDDGNGYVDDVRGWDFVDYGPCGPSTPAGEDCQTPDNDPMDFVGHGTAVAGVAAALSNNSIGVAGMCWNCKIMPVRVGMWDTTGAYILSSWVASGVRYAADNGADVINLSLSDPNWPSSPAKDAIDYAYAKGIVIVASAGNHGEDSHNFPAAYEKVIGVAATDALDQRAVWCVPQPPLNQKCESDYGTWVTVSAPGSAIQTTAFDNTYAAYDGTSLSAPIVSGLAALIHSLHPTFTADEVKKVIYSTTDHINSAQYMGTGRVNAQRALLMTAVPVAKLAAPVHNQTLQGTSFTILGTASSPNFGLYKLQYAVGVNPTSWTTITTSTTSVPATNGTLGSWNLSALLDNTVYTLRLSVTDKANNTAIDEVVVNLQSRTKAGWPQNVAGTISGISLADLVGDGKQEIIVRSARRINAGTFAQDLYVFRADGTLVSGWPRQNLGRSSYAAPTVVDINGDGKPEIVYQTETWGYPNTTLNFYVFDMNGNNLPGWPVTVTTPVINGADSISFTPIVADLNNNGTKELIFVCWTGQIYIYNANGTPFGPWPINIPLNWPPSTFSAGGYASGATVVDLDGDGKPEIVVTLGTYPAATVYAFKYDGTVLAGWPYTLPDGYLANLISGDIDHNGTPEIIGADNNGNVYVWNANGTVRSGWPKTVPQYAGSPILLDLESDLNLEIGVCSGDGHVFLWRNNGTAVSGWPISLPGGGCSGSSAVDITGDGVPELIQPSPSQALIHVYNSNGTVLSGWPRTLASPLISGPIFGDIDHDGNFDMVFAQSVGTDQSAVSAWDLGSPYSSARMQWGLPRFDPANTAHYTTPGQAPLNAPKNFRKL